MAAAHGLPTGMSAALTPDEISTILHNVVLAGLIVVNNRPWLSPSCLTSIVSNIIAVAATVMMAWDILITLDNEVQRVWCSRRAGRAWKQSLYFAVRYWPFLVHLCVPPISVRGWCIFRDATVHPPCSRSFNSMASRSASPRASRGSCSAPYRSIVAQTLRSSPAPSSGKDTSHIDLAAY